MSIAFIVGFICAPHVVDQRPGAWTTGALPARRSAAPRIRHRHARCDGGIDLGAEEDPLLAGKDYAAGSVFEPENLLSAPLFRADRRALRDEGTSTHYLPSARRSRIGD
jgi:hypothetical protein